LSYSYVKDKNGKIVDRLFQPNARMIRYAVEATKPENKTLSNEALALKCGMPKQCMDGWKKNNKIFDDNKNEIGNPFVEWFEDFTAAAHMDYRAALKMVGKTKALSGNFKFWKEEAVSEGVIKDSNPEVKIYNIPVNLGDNASLEDIKRARNALLDANAGMDDTKGAELLTITAEGQEKAGS